MRIKKFNICLAAFVACLWASGSQAETVLVTPEEALLPALPALTQRGPIPGPKVEFTAPDKDGTVKSPFALTAIFTRLSAADIDPKTVHIILMRGDGVDVTDRVRPAGTIDQSGVNLRDLVAPAGEYRLRLSVQDARQRPGFAEITL